MHADESMSRQLLFCTLVSLGCLCNAYSNSDGRQYATRSSYQNTLDRFATVLLAANPANVGSRFRRPCRRGELAQNAVKSLQGSRNILYMKDSERSRPQVSAPSGFTPPEPQPLTVTGDILSVVTGSLALLLRLGSGIFVLGWSPFGSKPKNDNEYSLSIGPLAVRDDSMMIRGECARPAEPLILYEYEASPFCRIVRETMGMLDLTVELKPCPGARAGFSDELFERTGRRTVPYLVDPNTGKEMFESSDIIKYLFNTYGPGEEQIPGVLNPGLAITTSTFAALARGMAGSVRQPNARPDNEQMLPIELWGYEGSPFVRPVREKLCALALPHKMVFSCRGSANRDVLFAKTGRFQVPYIVDPNTGVEMFESIEIVKYLEDVYTIDA